MNCSPTLEREGVELPPVVVHTARDLTREEELQLREHAESIVIKDVRSQETAAGRSVACSCTRIVKPDARGEAADYPGPP